MRQRLLKKRSVENDAIPISYETIGRDYYISETSEVLIGPNNEPVGVHLKGYFSEGEFALMRTYILEKMRDKLSRKEMLEIDTTTRPFVDKICETTKQFDSPKRFDALHVFNNFPIGLHRDSPNRSMGHLFVVKADAVNAFTVFPEYELAINLQNRDLLLFDINALHYVQTEKELTKETYRYPMYFDST